MHYAKQILPKLIFLSLLLLVVVQPNHLHTGETSHLVIITRDMGPQTKIVIEIGYKQYPSTMRSKPHLMECKLCQKKILNKGKD